MLKAVPVNSCPTGTSAETPTAPRPEKTLEEKQATDLWCQLPELKGKPASRSSFPCSPPNLEVSDSR